MIRISFIADTNISITIHVDERHRISIAFLNQNGIAFAHLNNFAMAIIKDGLTELTGEGSYVPISGRLHAVIKNTFKYLKVISKCNKIQYNRFHLKTLSRYLLINYYLCRESHKLVNYCCHN